MILLAEMRIRKETPSLGALCRWVRTLDVISGLSIHVQVPSQTVVGKNASNEELVRVLDAILRVTGPTDTTSHGIDARASPISLQETWNLRPATEPTRQLRRTIADKSIFTSAPIEKEIRALSAALEDVKDEQEYIVVRERLHRDSEHALSLYLPLKGD